MFTTDLFPGEVVVLSATNERTKMWEGFEAEVISRPRTIAERVEVYLRPLSARPDSKSADNGYWALSPDAEFYWPTNALYKKVNLRGIPTNALLAEIARRIK